MALTAWFNRVANNIKKDASVVHASRDNIKEDDSRDAVGNVLQLVLIGVISVVAVLFHKGHEEKMRDLEEIKLNLQNEIQEKRNSLKYAVGNVLKPVLVGVISVVVVLLDKASQEREHTNKEVEKKRHEEEIRDLEEIKLNLQNEIQEKRNSLELSQSWEVTFALGQEHAELSKQCAEPRKTKDCLEVRTHYLTASQKKVQELEQRNEEVKEKMKQQNERYEQRIRELEEINIKLEKEILEQRNKHAAELDRYAMGPAAPRGICLVINNFNFFGKEERQGAELDEEAIASLFHELHFIVEIRQNLGGREILDVAQEMAAIDHSNYEAFVFCIMSHGDKKDVIYGVDDRKAGVEDLMSEFTPTNCRTLENKPKLFFIQACRGQKSDSRRNRLSSVLSSNIADDGIQIMHSPDADLANGLSAREADFLLAFATVPGYKAWRSKQVGSWFIQVLVDVIRTYHCRHHLLDMLTEVNKRVAAIANDYPDDDLSFQVPAPTHTLRAQVFL